MLTRLFIIILIGISVGCFSKTFKRPENMVVGNEKPGFYELSIQKMDGSLIELEEFRGRKILIVNVASECGFTPQYADLQELFLSRKEKLVILGFPCNDFGKQEPGSNEEIKRFCTEKYEVTFPLFDKITLEGDQRPPLYQWLTDEKKNGWNVESPNWNFCKYLVNEKGELTHFFQSAISPMSDELLEALDE
jgi:glutathione peroxidase